MKIRIDHTQGLTIHLDRVLELEGVPGYTGTRESYVRFAGRSPLYWTPEGLPKPGQGIKTAYGPLD